MWILHLHPSPTPRKLLTVVLLWALWFLSTIPLPGGGIPPMNGKRMRIAIKIERVTKMEKKNSYKLTVQKCCSTSLNVWHLNIISNGNSGGQSKEVSQRTDGRQVVGVVSWCQLWNNCGQTCIVWVVEVDATIATCPTQSWKPSWKFDIKTKLLKVELTVKV